MCILFEMSAKAVSEMCGLGGGGGGGAHIFQIGAAHLTVHTNVHSTVPSHSFSVMLPFPGQGRDPMGANTVCSEGHLS